MRQHYKWCYQCVLLQGVVPPSMPLLEDWHSSYRRSTPDEIILCHAHIGHTFLTDSFILAGDHPPPCEHCQCILTVHHILERYPYLQPIRDDVFGNEGVMESPLGKTCWSLGLGSLLLSDVRP